MFKKIKTTALFPLIVTLVLFLLKSFSGCGSETVAPPPPPVNPSDTNVIIFDSLTVYEFHNDLSYSAVDLYLGKVVYDSTRTKDIHLADSFSLGERFYFRSGDLSLDVPGYQTVFNSPYADLTQAQFDTLTKIPDSDSQLDSTDFTQPDTQFWLDFIAPLAQHRVYGFYLKGKYAGGITPTRVYGVIYLKSAASIGLGNFTVTISVRINKNGENWFKKH